MKTSPSAVRSVVFAHLSAVALLAAGCSSASGNVFGETDAASSAPTDDGSSITRPGREAPDAAATSTGAKPGSGPGTLMGGSSDAGGGAGSSCAKEGETQPCGRGIESDAAAGVGVDAAALVTELADAGCLLGTQTCRSQGEFLAWSACTSCEVECRTHSVSFDMLQDNYDTPTLHGNEQIVSVATTGGNWCNCGDYGGDCGYTCPLTCPDGAISSDGTTMAVAMYDAPGQYGDNSGECSYQETICGTK